MPPAPALAAAEQYGWAVLLDLSRLVALEERAAAAPGSTAPAADVVPVQVVSGDDSDGGARSLVDALRSGYTLVDGSVRVPRAVLRAVARVAGAALDQRATTTDRYGRVPSTANPLVEAGCEREPLVSLAAAAFRRAALQAAGRRRLLLVPPWPEGRRWAAAFTHDLDVVAAWPVFTGLRMVELVRKRRIREAASVAVAAGRSGLGDPVTDGVRTVLAIEARGAVTSTWFVLCGTPTLATFRRGDLTYRPESGRARRIVGAIRGAGHEIGLHGSFATTEDDTAFAAQRTRLGALVGDPPLGVRQHFLRMRPGATQRAMAGAGFLYDATYGFSDRNGFRLGVADVVPVWDDVRAGRGSLDEVPLVWMDRAQSKYQGIEDPAQWIDDAEALARTSEAVEGLWVGLWHPNLTTALGFPGASVAYERLVRSVCEREPWVAPLARVVAWRRLRRAVRARVMPDGAMTVEVPGSRAFDVPVLDGSGRVVATARAGEDPAPQQLRLP